MAKKTNLKALVVISVFLLAILSPICCEAAYLEWGNEIADAWGEQIRYSVDEQGIITLLSLGKDKAVGGNGDDADIIYEFTPRKPNGQWEKVVGSDYSVIFRE